MCSGHSELGQKKSDMISTFKNPVGGHVHNCCVIDAFQASDLR